MPDSRDLREKAAAAKKEGDASHEKAGKLNEAADAAETAEKKQGEAEQ